MAIPWFVIVLFVAIGLQRLLQTQIFPTLYSCEATVFWLSGWEDHRSVMQVTGATIAAFWAWWLVGFTRRGWRVHLFAGLVLLGWTAAFNHHLLTLLPDRAHPVAFWIDDLPLIADTQIDIGPARPRWAEDTTFIGAGVPGIAKRLALDTAPDWYLGRTVHREIYAPDRPHVTEYPRLERRDGLRGRDAPTYGQLEAARACIAYNRWSEGEVEAALAAGDMPWVPGRFTGPDGYWADDIAWTTSVMVPPVPVEAAPWDETIVIVSEAW